MSAPISCKFWKLHGCKNSFVVVKAQAGIDWNAAAQRLCNVNSGVGADGLLVVSQTAVTTHFLVFMFNPDGSSMGMCGNGTRCVVRFIFLEQMLSASETDKQETLLTFDVNGRAIKTRSSLDGREVEVDMGEPALQDSPGGKNIISLPGFTCEFLSVSMGNPHCVIFDSSIDYEKATELGPQIEKLPLFPQRTNVEFVNINSDNTLSVNVWERGAGQTQACGTGACAVLVAAVIQKKSGRSNTVHLPGGKLSVRWDEKSNHVFLTGPAEEICFGEVDLY